MARPSQNVDPGPAPRPVLRHVAVAVFSLLLASLAFYPVDQPLLAYVAFVPWMFHHQRHRPPGTARALMAAYYLHFAYMLMWVAEVAPVLVWIIPLMGLPFVVLTAWLLDLSVHRLRLPPIWCYAFGITGMEVLRSACLGVSWCPVGYSAWRQLRLIQTATVFGVYGPTFAILACNAALAGLLDLGADRLRGGSRPRGSRRCLWRLLGFAPLVLFWAWGALLLAGVRQEPGPLVLGVQPDVPLKVKVQGSRSVVWGRVCSAWLGGGGPTSDPDILVVPETVFFASMLPERPLEEELTRPDPRYPGGTAAGIFPRGRGQITIVGYSKYRRLPPGSDVVDEDGDGNQEWNVAGVVRDGKELVAEYAKRRLVPFGEYVPLPSWMPLRDWFKKRIKEQAGYIPDLTAGKEGSFTRFTLADGRSYELGLTICYEMAFPRYFREIARQGCDFAVNVSNDGWYGTSSELDLVNVAARFRAIENRRSLVRVTNTGISTLVDAAGRYVDTVEKDGRRKEVPGVLSGRIPVCHQQTLYARFGLLPAASFLFVFLGMLAFGAWRRGHRLSA